MVEEIKEETGKESEADIKEIENELLNGEFACLKREDRSKPREERSSPRQPIIKYDFITVAFSMKRVFLRFTILCPSMIHEVKLGCVLFSY